MYDKYVADSVSGLEKTQESLYVSHVVVRDHYHADLMDVQEHTSILSVG